ncbi:hypothetical protein RJ639_041728 [Escallonia herrerae]|uniref:Beta-glucosidase n=1 Tax=Escallonia herrerae TaxID=1293975 RepID=A0AA88WH34_9ASTE|nr:hypothetical protein RJ639_041728 [Escallonia herrerae]
MAVMEIGQLIPIISTRSCLVFRQLICVLYFTPLELADGTLYGGVVNLRGIQYYNNLINELIANGKVPYVTLFHWDLPQALEEEFGGFLNRRIVKEFRYFADICFSHFGDRVKHWFTLNEPWSFSYYGYVLGTLAPGRCSSWQHKNCTGGNSGEEPYWVTHNQILAHAAAVKVYRDRYQSYQKGGIGITLVSQYYEPCSDSNSGDEAVQRGLDFMLGWFLHPITYGDYPETMRSLVGERLPKFSQEQSKLLVGSFDFLGVNYYTTYYAVDAPKSNGEHPSYLTDSQITFLSKLDTLQILYAGNSDWLYIYPKGMRKLLNYIKQDYKDPPMFITENGVSEDDDPTLALIEALNDTIRRDYIEDHLCCLNEAIKEDGINMLGYFVWSLMDNFEWNSGSSVRFGVNYVDYKHGLHRYAKLSALWFKRFLSEEGSVSIPRISLDRGKDTYSVSSSVI